MPKISLNHFRWTGNWNSFNLMPHRLWCTNILANNASKSWLWMGWTCMCWTPELTDIFDDVSKVEINARIRISPSIFILLSSKLVHWKRLAILYNFWQKLFSKFSIVWFVRVRKWQYKFFWEYLSQFKQY